MGWEWESMEWLGIWISGKVLALFISTKPYSPGFDLQHCRKRRPRRRRRRARVDIMGQRKWCPFTDNDYNKTKILVI